MNLHYPCFKNYLHQLINKKQKIKILLKSGHTREGNLVGSTEQVLFVFNGMTQVISKKMIMEIYLK